MPIKINGKIIIGEPAFPSSGAKAYIRILDTTLADTASRVVAQKIISGLNLVRGKVTSIPFSLDCPILDSKKRNTIDVHVDCNGNGKVSHGDYITMQSYPLDQYDLGLPIEIEVRPVYN